MNKLFIKAIVPFTILLFFSIFSHAQTTRPQETISLQIKNSPEIGLVVGESSAMLSASANRGILSTAIDFAANFATRAIFSAFENIQKVRTAEWKTPAVKDYFYDAPSTLGALDPTGMKFAGILMSREMIGADTSSVFHLECSVPSDHKSMTDFITNSRFTMTLDSLAIDLSKVKAKYTRKKRISIEIDIALKATWVDNGMNVHKDQELGLFRISIPNMKYNEKSPIVTFGGEKAKAMLAGFSFFAPRSYGAFISNGKYQECWSAGEFEVQMTVKESTATPKKAGAAYAYEYLQKALPGSISQMSVNENIVGPGVMKIIKGY